MIVMSSGKDEGRLMEDGSDGMARRSGKSTSGINVDNVGNDT